MHNAKKIFFKLSIISFLAAVSLIVGLWQAEAQTAGDAIAVRVIPNPEHYSAARWYREKKFTGSPQALTVDGYEAVRDGRTVYVNAANVDAVANLFFTNIYLISYNQKAEASTADIFGRILEKWRFNTNIVSPGNCSLTGATVCVYDSECPAEEHCLSQKARIIRDTKRLADLTELGEALEEYRGNSGKYPILSSGTYLPRKSLSVWPSWKKVLGQILKFNIPVDPVNKMGNCGGAGFNPVTCWNEDNKTFPTNLDTPAFPDPGVSRVYFYSADEAGENVRYCALLETGYTNIGSYNCLVGIGANNPPQFTGAGLPPGTAGQPYRGYLEASDPDGDQLSWSISGGPVLQTSEAPNQRRVYVPNLTGNITFSATVNDGRGGVVSQTFTITVGSTDRPTVAAIGNYDIIIGADISFTALASEAAAHYPLRFDFAGAPSGFNGAGWIDANWHDWHVSGRVVDYTRNYGVALTVRDLNGVPSNLVVFNVNVRNNPPVINTGSLPAATACLPYNFTVSASDPDGHTLKYAMTGPRGLSINEDTGEISGRPETGAGDFPVRITVRDQYHNFTQSPYRAEAVGDFNLHINSESYDITLPLAYDFYVAPAGVNYENLYHSPFSYFGTAEKTTPNRVTWSLVTNPADLMSGLAVGINADTGEINAECLNNNINSGGYHFTAQVIASTHGCNIERSGSMNFTVYPNAWCGDGVRQSLEQCEGPGSGTGANNQWQCVNCSWSGGWCGNNNCEIIYETYGSCPDDCLGAVSEFSVCTDVVTQPSCYTNAVPSPILNWQYNSTANEYCDCDGTPLSDCPYGIPCLAESQTTYFIEVDDSADYSSPELRIGPVMSPNHFHQVNSANLDFGVWYYWRLRILTSEGNASDWVQCTGPFLVNLRCAVGESPAEEAASPPPPAPPAIPTSPAPPAPPAPPMAGG